MSEAARSNPRRRQRNSFDDSVATRQPVKRRKRGGITKDTFQPPESADSRGATSIDKNHNLPNGHSHSVEHSHDGENTDGTKLVIRDRQGGRLEDVRQTTSKVLTANEHYFINLVDTVPSVLTSPDSPVAWQCTIYPQIGHVVAVTHSEAFIWPYKARSSSSGRQDYTRIRLPLPSAKAGEALPLATITKFSAELSLLIVDPKDGTIVFWESIREAAALDVNRQRHQSIKASLGSMFSNETVKSIDEAESRGFVITLSSGRLVHLSLGDEQGKTTIKTSFMKSTIGQPSGIFGSLRGVFSGSGWKPIAAVRSADSIRRGQRHVLTATTLGTFQIWDMSWNGTHALETEINMMNEIQEALESCIKRDSGLGFPESELVDFTLPALDDKQNLTPMSTRDNRFQAIALCAIKVPSETLYAVIRLNLSKQDSSVDMVRMALSTSKSRTSNSRFRPSILVPKPGHAAIVVFENSVEVLSLVQEKESPSSQLQVEAHVLPDYFQDVIHLRKDRPFQVVGCSVDFSASNPDSSTSLIAVQNAGLMRIVVHSLQDDKSPVHREAITARKKLEQAVFFSDVQGNFIDFALDNDLAFSEADVEKAAVGISRSITDSSSPFLKTLNLSMESQLSNRASKLKNLIYHIQNSFGPISQSTRWNLLWDAEKVAAAQELWRWYNDHHASTDNRQSIFAEMIEAIPETLKVENQPDQGETDGVRHWFTNDVWRLEWILPYSHEIIELLFKESREDRHEMDETTRARMISIAAKIQTIALETAFTFRSENARAYGFDPSLLDHGVLRKPELFETLPEFWTSSRLGGIQPLVPMRVKEITDAAREMAKNLTVTIEDMVEQQAEAKSPEEKAAVDTEDTFSVMQQLRMECPRQVEVCEKVYREHGYWLEAQSDPLLHEAGKSIKTDYPLVRRQQLGDLAELGLAEEAIDLAEKHQDMEALLDVLESEVMESNSLGPSIPRRVESYFRRFGEAWSDAYFSRNLNRGQQASDILRGSSFKQHLTGFLRRHPEYARLSWINEVSSERDYARASQSLYQASQDTSEVWPEKIMLSLTKLSLLAAQAKDPTRPHFMPDAARRRMDCELQNLQMQEDLYATLRMYVKRAIDDDAAVDVVMDHHGIRITDTTAYFAKQAQNYLRQVLAHQTLGLTELADLLSLLHEDSVESEASPYFSQRFFLALKCVYFDATVQDKPMESAEILPMFKAVWRRLLIASDWTALNRTEKKSDAEVSQGLKETILYQTFVAGYKWRSKADGANFWELMPPPSHPQDVLDGGEQVEALKSAPQDEDATPVKDLPKIGRDFQYEDKKLQGYLEKGRLSEWFLGVMEAARTAVQGEDDLKDSMKRVGSGGELVLKTGKARLQDRQGHEDVNGSV